VCPFFARRSARSSGLGAEWDAVFEPRPQHVAAKRAPCELPVCRDLKASARRGSALTHRSKAIREGGAANIEVGKAFPPTLAVFGHRAGNGSCMHHTSRRNS
jgi:hypothetical protein